MKTIEKAMALMVMGLLIMGLSTKSYAQERSYGQQNVIKVKPLSFELGYERALNHFISVQASARVLPFRIGFDNDETTLSYNNYRIMPEVRFYLASREGAPEGFFLAPYAKAGITTVKAQTESESDLTARVKFRGNSLGAGATVGWQWITDSGFSIDTQFGWGINRLKFKDVAVTYEDGTTEVEKAPIGSFYTMLPRFSFSLGYAF